MNTRVTKEEETQIVKMFEELKNTDFENYKYLVGVMEGMYITLNRNKILKN